MQSIISKRQIAGESRLKTLQTTAVFVLLFPNDHETVFLSEETTSYCFARDRLIVEFTFSSNKGIGREGASCTLWVGTDLMTPLDFHLLCNYPTRRGWCSARLSRSAWLSLIVHKLHAQEETDPYFSFLMPPRFTFASLT